MSLKRVVHLLVFSLAISPTAGCSMIGDGIHITSHNLADSLSDSLEHARNCRWAEGAWQMVRSSDPRDYSKDYARGFKDGFAAYLWDGHAEAPPVSPARYRRIGYQTPEGYRAAEDWFIGYHRGVHSAIATGYRQWITGPVPPPAANEQVASNSASRRGPADLTPSAVPIAKIGAPQTTDSALTPAATPAATIGFSQADQAPPQVASSSAKLGAPRIMPMTGADQ